MTKSEYKQLEIDTKTAINNAMSAVHRKWSKEIDPEELRLIVCRILSDRAFEAALESVQKALKPTRKIDRMIKLLQLGHTPSQAANLVEATPTTPQDQTSQVTQGSQPECQPEA